MSTLEVNQANYTYQTPLDADLSITLVSGETVRGDVIASGPKGCTVLSNTGERSIQQLHMIGVINHDSEPNADQSPPSVNQSQLVIDLVLNHSETHILNGDDIEFSAFDWMLTSDTLPTDGSPIVTLYGQSWIGRPKAIAEYCEAVKCPDGSLVLDRKSMKFNDINLDDHSWEALPIEEALELHVGLKVTCGRHAMLAKSYAI